MDRPTMKGRAKLAALKKMPDMPLWCFHAWRKVLTPDFTRCFGLWPLPGYCVYLAGAARFPQEKVLAFSI